MQKSRNVRDRDRIFIGTDITTGKRIYLSKKVRKQDYTL